MEEDDLSRFDEKDSNDKEGEDQEEEGQDDNEEDEGNNDEEDEEEEDEDEDEEEEEEEDLIFGAEVTPGRLMKKSYHVDFKVCSISDITRFQRKEIGIVSGILGCPPHHSAILLRAYKWNKEKLIEKYMDSSELVLTSSGITLIESSSISPSSTLESQRIKLATNGFSCEICCNDESDLLTCGLDCGHLFCRDCYSQYLTQKIVQEGESRRIQCMADGCDLVLDENTVEMCVEKEVNDK